MWKNNIDWLPVIHVPTRDRTPNQASALTGNQTRDLSLCKMTPNQLSHTSQGYFLNLLTVSPTMIDSTGLFGSLLYPQPQEQCLANNISINKYHLNCNSDFFIFFKFKSVFYWLCYYSCPIFFSPLFPSSLHHPLPLAFRPPPLVHVHGWYI